MHRAVSRRGRVFDRGARATLTAEVGKPIGQPRNELNGFPARIDFFVDEVGRVTAARTVFDDASMPECISHEPLGLEANISAWNSIRTSSVATSSGRRC